MVIYDNYTAESGVERAKAYSNQNMMIERDGALYSEADDFVYQNRKYTETDKPIDIDPIPEPETDLTVADTLGMLKELGVNTDD
jgi:hypothetical protein